MSEAFIQTLALSFLFAAAVTLVAAKIRGDRRASFVTGPSPDLDANLEANYGRISAGTLVDRLGLDRARSIAAQPYPIGDAARRPAWWYLRRRIVLELTRRSQVEPSFLKEFYRLPDGGESAPDEAAQVRQAVLSFMLGPARELFPFDDVPVQPPMPLSLFLLCREAEEPHPVEYPGVWNWMKVTEFAKVMNPNVRVGEHFVLEPPAMERDGQSARVRFRWGTPPGVYLQDVQVRKMDEIWAVAAIRDTFKLR